MSFDVGAQAYDRFMGRYSEPLAGLFVDQVDVQAGNRVLDVGCGPGALTALLVARVGASHVAAIDPSESFVSAARERFPGVDVRLGSAESLPYSADEFDVVLAQLVVHFMADAVAGLTEMRRVTRPGGVVAASVWDHGSGRGPLSPFWRAVHDLDPQARDESDLPGSREGQLAQLFRDAGLLDVETTLLTVRADHPTFDDWWVPFTYGVGPSGNYVASLDDAHREALRAHCEEILPDPPFFTEASAWTVVARA